MNIQSQINVYNYIRSKLKGVLLRNPNSAMALCPCHEDKNISLLIQLLDDGRIIMCCLAGCSVEDICKKLSIRAEDIIPIAELKEVVVQSEFRKWWRNNGMPDCPTCFDNAKDGFKQALKIILDKIDAGEVTDVNQPKDILIWLKETINLEILRISLETDSGWGEI